MIAQSKHQPSATTRDTCRLFFRHKKKALACFALSIAAALAIIFLWPRSYKSEAKLFVQVGRESVSLDPTATTGQVVPVSLSRETEINSVLEMLRSRVMVEKLVDELGPTAILKSSTTTSPAGEESTSALSSLVAFINPDPVSDRERAIAFVEKHLDFAVEKKSDVITVQGTGKSPAFAQQMVDKFIDTYLGEHAQMHRTAGSRTFFTEQTVLLRKNLGDALAKLRDAKNELGIVSLEGQRQILQNETIEVENRLAASNASLAAAKKKAEALRARIENLPERLATEETKGYANAAVDNMRQDLYQLQIREAELASRFTDTFPALVAVREQIKVAKQPLGQEEQRRTQSTTTVNTVHDQIHLSLLNEESEVESLEAAAHTLDEQLAQLRQRDRALNENEAQIVNLEQEVALCKANYTTYSEKSEQSRIDAALQNERITNVNVIQPANLVAKPVSPRKAVVLVLGIFGGLALAIGIALLAEFLDPTLKTPDEVEERLSLPVLLSVPRVAQRHTVLN